MLLQIARVCRLTRGAHPERFHLPDPVLHRFVTGLRAGPRYVLGRRQITQDIVVQQHVLVHREPFAADPRGERRAFGIGRRDGGIHELRRLQLFHRVQKGRSLVIAPYGHAVPFGPVVDKCDEGREMGGGRPAIVAREVFVDEPLFIIRRIPEQMRNEIMTERGE